VIERDGDKEKFNVSGVIKQTSPTTVEITELPIHKWTEGYKEFLEASIIGGQPTEKEKEKEKDKEKEKKSKIPERFIQVRATIRCKFFDSTNRELKPCPTSRTTRSITLVVTFTSLSPCPPTNWGRRWKRVSSLSSNSTPR
jgi:hypothetical protein